MANRRPFLVDKLSDRAQVISDGVQKLSEQLSVAPLGNYKL